MTKRVARLKSRKEGYKSKAYWRYLKSREILMAYSIANIYGLDGFLTRILASTDYWSGHVAKRAMVANGDRDPCSKSSYEDLHVPAARPYDHRLRVYALDAQERRLVAIANRLVRPVALRLRDPTNMYYLTSDIYWFDEVIDLSNEPDPE